MEKQILCCGSGVWTRVIAWFEIVLSAIMIILVSLILVSRAAAWATADTADKNRDGTPLTPEQIHDKKAKLTPEIVDCSIRLILAVTSFVIAIVLLLGSYNRRAGQICAWMIYTAIYLAISTINGIVIILIAPTGGIILSTVIYLVVVFAIQGFCLWVVGVHKKEIDASSSGRGFPAFP